MADANGADESQPLVQGDKAKKLPGGYLAGAKVKSLLGVTINGQRLEEDAEGTVVGPCSNPSLPDAKQRIEVDFEGFRFNLLAKTEVEDLHHIAGLERHFYDIPWKKGSLRDPEVEDDEDFEDFAHWFHGQVSDLKKKLKDTTDDMGKMDKNNKGRWFQMKKEMTDLEKFWDTQVTAEKFVQVLEFIGPDAADFVNCMAFRIMPEVWGLDSLTTALKLYPGRSVLFQPKHIGCKLDTRHAEDRLPGFHEDPNAETAREEHWVSDEYHEGQDPEGFPREQPLHLVHEQSQDQRSWWFGGNKTEFHVAWTTANHLFVKDTDTQIYVVKALADTGSRSGVFNMVVGKCIMDQAWKKVENLFLVERFLDILLLFNIGYIQYCVSMQQCPPVWAAVILFTLVIKNMIQAIVQLFAAITLYGFSVDKFFSFVNTSFFVLDFFTGIVLMCMVVQDYKLDNTEYKDHSFAASHAVLFMTVIFLRWLQLLLSLNCTKLFGENVLPAFDAVTRKESFVYLTFLALCCVAIFQAYFSLPIDENHAGKLMVPVLKIFRLIIVGDFDVEELEGEDPPFSGDTTFNASTGVITGGLDDADLDARFKNGVRVGFIVSSTAITIMMMNVGIGLLSSLYNDAVAVKHQIHSYYKAEYCVKLLMLVHVFECIFHCHCGEENDHHYEDCSIHRGEAYAGKHHMCGYWIASDSGQLKDKTDMGDLADIIEDKNKDFSKRMRVLTKHVDCLKQRIKNIPEVERVLGPAQ